jgi:hypothetical protein
MPLAILSKVSKERFKLVKSQTKKGREQQTTRESKEPSETILRTYIPLNWKIWKKWTNF